MFTFIECTQQETVEKTIKIYVEKYNTNIYVTLTYKKNCTELQRCDIRDYRMQEASWLDKDIKDSILEYIKKHHI
jgi:hypothetical protein